MKVLLAEREMLQAVGGGGMESVAEKTAVLLTGGARGRNLVAGNALLHSAATSDAGDIGDVGDGGAVGAGGHAGEGRDGTGGASTAALEVVGDVEALPVTGPTAEDTARSPASLAGLLDTVAPVGVVALARVGDRTRGAGRLALAIAVDVSLVARIATEVLA